MPKLDPLFYASNRKYGKYTRLHAAAAAFDLKIITMDAYIYWLDVILNGGES
jgi:hypothetical protein